MPDNNNKNDNELGGPPAADNVGVSKHLEPVGAARQQRHGMDVGAAGTAGTVPGPARKA